MARAPLIADTLSAWREAERLAERLPGGSREQRTAREIASELHALYQELTEHQVASAETVTSSRVTIVHAREVLAGFGSSR